MAQSDRDILRALAARYLEICSNSVQDERRSLWRRLNSLKPARPLIYVRAFAWGEMAESRLECQDPFYHPYETSLRHALFWDTLADDSIFEPWLTVPAACVTPAEGWGGVWGMPVEWEGSGDPRGSKRWDAPIVEPEDAKRLVAARHEIDDEETARRASKVHDALGDVLAIHVDRAPVFRSWNADISTQLAQLRGLGQIMLDMVERPEWLHELLAFMRDGILRAQDEAERAGDWTLANHGNQAMPYAEELDDPAPNGPSVTRDQLWVFCASQELAQVGPGMFDEFMFQYQEPILRKFALTAYGCCEDLALKIDVIRRLPNLRRIAVAPAADAARCADRIGRDYVVSYRPSPSDMVGYGFDPDRIRRILRRDLEACRECNVDVTLKDVETVQNDPTRVRRWVEITREVIDEVW